MTTQNVAAKLFDELNDLPPEKQQEVLAFARSLKSRAVGVKGSSLLSFADNISSSDLVQMREAIEAECERIDVDEW